MRALFLLFLAAFALAQAPKPLKVGELTGEALYPGNRGVSYGEVGLVARGLGLALWRTPLASPTRPRWASSWTSPGPGSSRWRPGPKATSSASAGR